MFNYNISRHEINTPRNTLCFLSLVIPLFFHIGKQQLAKNENIIVCCVKIKFWRLYRNQFFIFFFYSFFT